MEWSVLVKRLMDEYGEKWKIATRITDCLDTAIDHMDKAIDEYHLHYYDAGDAYLSTAKVWIERFKDLMNGIDPEVSEYLYTTFMITVNEIELAKENDNILFQISEFKIPALLQMVAQLFAVLLLYY